MGKEKTRLNLRSDGKKNARSERSRSQQQDMMIKQEFYATQLKRRLQKI
jgi:hypothetical protein